MRQPPENRRELVSFRFYVSRQTHKQECFQSIKMRVIQWEASFWQILAKLLSCKYRTLLSSFVIEIWFKWWTWEYSFIQRLYCAAYFDISLILTVFMLKCIKHSWYCKSAQKHPSNQHTWILLHWMHLCHAQKKADILCAGLRVRCHSLVPTADRSLSGSLAGNWREVTVIKIHILHRPVTFA